MQFLLFALCGTHPVRARSFVRSGQRQVRRTPGAGRQVLAGAGPVLTPGLIGVPGRGCPHHGSRAGVTVTGVLAASVMLADTSAP